MIFTLCSSCNNHRYREEKVTDHSVQDVPFGRCLNEWWINVLHLLCRVHISMIKMAVIGYIKVCRCSSVLFYSLHQDWKTKLHVHNMMDGIMLDKTLLELCKAVTFSKYSPRWACAVDFCACQMSQTHVWICHQQIPRCFANMVTPWEERPLLSFCIFSRFVWQPQAAFPWLESGYDGVCLKLLRFVWNLGGISFLNRQNLLIPDHERGTLSFPEREIRHIYWPLRDSIKS